MGDKGANIVPVHGSTGMELRALHMRPHLYADRPIAFRQYARQIAEESAASAMQHGYIPKGTRMDVDWGGWVQVICPCTALRRESSETPKIGELRVESMSSTRPWVRVASDLNQGV